MLAINIIADISITKNMVVARRENPKARSTRTSFLLSKRDCIVITITSMSHKRILGNPMSWTTRTSVLTSEVTVSRILAVCSGIIFGYVCQSFCSMPDISTSGISTVPKYDAGNDDSTSGENTR